MKKNKSCHSIKETYKIIKGSEDGFKKINEYKFKKKLGAGSYGKVKLAVKTQTNEEFAIKIFKKSFLKRKKEVIKQNGKKKITNALQNVSKEIAVMKKLNHPNVIKLNEVIDDLEHDFIYIILDYAEKGQLIEWDNENGKFFYVRDDYGYNFLKEEDLRKIFRDCLKGLNYLHSNNIIHRDIKPQNILFGKDNVAKISDFGLSILYESSVDNITCTNGTTYFLPPESISKEVNSNGYSGKKADIWSLGVSFYCFVFLQVPFEGTDALNIMENIENGLYCKKFII